MLDAQTAFVIVKIQVPIPLHIIIGFCMSSFRLSEEVHRTIIESGIDVKIVSDISKTILPALKITVSCPGDPMQLMSHPKITQLNSKYTVIATAEHYFDITRKDEDKGVAVSKL